MKSRLLALAALALMGLVASSCSSTDPAAATVNGEEISRKDFEDQTERLASQVHASLKTNPDTTGQVVDPIDDANPGTIDADWLRGELRERILDLVITQELTRRGLTAGPDDTAFAEQISDPNEFAGIDDDIAQRKKDQRARLVALAAALVEIDGFDDTSVQKVFDADPTSYEQTCVSHILVATKDEADAALARLQAGEEFAALASELSTDTGSAAQGGSLGCVGKDAGFVPEFQTAMDAAEIGKVTDPVESQFGFHLILVTDRKVPAFADAKQSVIQGLVSKAGQALQDFLSEAVLGAKISIDPRYGTWNSETGFIDAGGSEPPPTTGPGTSASEPASTVAATTAANGG